MIRECSFPQKKAFSWNSDNREQAKILKRRDEIMWQISTGARCTYEKKKKKRKNGPWRGFEELSHYFMLTVSGLEWKIFLKNDY